MSFFFLLSTLLFFVLFYTYYFFTVNLNLNKIFTPVKTKTITKLSITSASFTFFQIFIALLILEFLFLCTLCCTETFFFNKNLLITNFSLNLFAISLFLNICVIVFLKQLVFLKIINLSIDFIYSIGLMCLLAPYIFFQNNLISLFLFLEFLNILFFFNFVTIFTSTKVKNSKNSKNSYANFLNLVFFQFWISFFSSILLLWAILHIYMIFGTTEFFFVNFFIRNICFQNFNIQFLSCIFLFAFLLKIGIAPLHFLKIELYKNLPYLNIFLFSCFYFIYFILFLFYLFILQLPAVIMLTGWLIFFILICSTIFFCLYMFDVTFFKTFFALSTVLNFINAIAILYCGFIFV